MNPAAHAWYEALWKEARQLGGRAVFTGAGGNVGLSYDGLLALANWTRQGRFLKVASEIRCMARLRETHWPGLSRAAWRYVMAPVSPTWLRRGVDHWRGHRVWPPDLRFAAVSPDYYDQSGICRDIAAGGRATYPDGPPDATGFRHMGFWAHRHRIADAAEANRLRYGITVLHPLFDRELLEFCFAIPLDQYLHNGQTRHLARRVLADRVPKHAFEPVPPLEQGGDRVNTLSVHRDLFGDILGDVAKSGMAREILDLPRLRRLLHNWPADDAWRRPGLEPGYGNAIPRALHIGQFIRWSERSNQ